MSGIETRCNGASPQHSLHDTHKHTHTHSQQLHSLLLASFATNFESFNPEPFSQPPFKPNVQGAQSYSMCNNTHSSFAVIAPPYYPSHVTHARTNCIYLHIPLPEKPSEKSRPPPENISSRPFPLSNKAQYVQEKKRHSTFKTQNHL